MEERIIRLPELMMFHQITEVWNESIACFSMDSSMKNISKVPPVLADMFSFILVEEGTARYVLNYKEYTVQGGDLLLFSPSMLVSLVNSSDDFKSRNLMCERSLFEHMLSSNPAYQTYSYYFCRRWSVWNGKCRRPCENVWSKSVCPLSTATFIKRRLFNA